MQFFTTEQVPGMEIVEVHGLVSASVVRSKNVFKDLGASLKSIVGGELRSYTDLMKDARENVLRSLTAQAAGMGANAVICLRMTTSQIMAGASEIYAYGTAVTIK